MTRSTSLACLCVLAAGVSVFIPRIAEAGDRLLGYLDVGTGAMRTHPYVTGPATGVSAGIGVLARLGNGPVGVGCELRAASASGPGSMIPEAAKGGTQGLVTGLVVVEAARTRRVSGAFVSAGLGFGHSTISDARGATSEPNYGFVALPGRSAVAYGIGAGWRFGAGQGPAHVQLALRHYGLLRDISSLHAYTDELAVGLAL